MGILKILRDYTKNNLGVAAIWFGMTVPMVISAVGVSLDVGQTYLVRERLSHAIDAAALAAAGSASEDPAYVEDRVNDFIEANYPPDKVGFTIDVNVENYANTLSVNATARLDTAFLKVVGKEYVDVVVETEVTKEVKAIEVVLVMDVTGSMATKNAGVARIDSLKSAAKLFVKTMFERIEDKKDLKIGLVPFSGSVNVGTYGLGKTPGGLTYDTAFMSNPLNLQYFDPLSKSSPSNSEKKRWWGCVLEGATPTDTQDHGGPWNMYRYCRNSSDVVKCDSTNATNDANIGCPRTSITPLTNVRTELDTSIGKLEAVGSTYINVGLVWGHRMISPEYPFQEAEPWSDPDWKKAIVLMTDGVNEVNANYSAYGLSSAASMTNTKLNNRMLDVCDDLRNKKVLVYTITFDKGVSSDTKKLFEKCATHPNMWHDAPDGTKLQEVYLTIAKELANLHISK